MSIEIDEKRSFRLKNNIGYILKQQFIDFFLLKTLEVIKRTKFYCKRTSRT